MQVIEQNVSQEASFCQVDEKSLDKCKKNMLSLDKRLANRLSNILHHLFGVGSISLSVSLVLMAFANKASIRAILLSSMRE